MDSFKPIIVMAILLVVLVAGVVVYSDSTISKKDYQICKLENQVNHTKKKCVE